MRYIRVGLGIVFVCIGLFMVIADLRQGGSNAARAIMGPLGLMSAGALAISSGRNRKS